MRLMIVFCLFVVVIMLMMDCAKKTMKKKQKMGEEGESHGWMVPGNEPGPYWTAAHPAFARKG